MNDDVDEGEEPIKIDFTDQSQLQWRQGEEGYSPSQFFSNDSLHDRFVTRLSADIDQPVIQVRKRYAEYLAAQIQHIADDWSLNCWTDTAAETVAKELLSQYYDDEFNAIRGKFLEEATDQQLWGQNRYKYVRRQFSLKLLERVGAENFRQVIDVRPETQFEIHYPEQPRVDTKLFTVDRLNDVAVRQLLEAFGISKRELVRAALPFHSRLEASRLVRWTTQNIKYYSDIHELPSDRWQYATRPPMSLSIPEFTAAVITTVNQEKSVHTVRDLITDIRSKSPRQGMSARRLTDFVSEMASVSHEAINSFNQILSGGLHPDRRPDIANADQSASHEKVSERTGRDIHSFSDEKPPTRMDDIDRAYPRLFIIPAAGKPTEIERREIGKGELDRLDDIEELDQLNENYTAYAAPASQHRAVSGMSAGDVVLFATEQSEYIGEYRIEHILIAPEMVQDIWGDSVSQNNGQTRIPFLLLLSRPRTRKFAQQRLNQLLGYRSTSTPSHWGVAQDRIKQLTDAGSSLEEILRRLDQE